MTFVDHLHRLFTAQPTLTRIGLIAVLAIGVHVAVRVVRAAAARLSAGRSRPSRRKIRSVVSLASSVMVFTLYFGAVGGILQQLGVSLTAYFASASIIGLAVAFGSQGMIQDVVTGLTLIFSDLFNVGDMVEIGGQAGLVRSIGMRFTVLENALGAQVFIPNRSISNVLNYPRGYVRCIVDVTVPETDRDNGAEIEAVVTPLMNSVYERFPGILVTAPSLEGRFRTSGDKEFLRLKFRIWPGRGGPIEGTFKAELLQALKARDGSYADWMVSVYYEVEKPKTEPGAASFSFPPERRRS